VEEQALGIVGEAIRSLGAAPFYLWLTLLTFALVFLVLSLSKNTTITEALATRIADVETPAIVKQIREDQIISNQERQKQSVKIQEIEGRLWHVEVLLGNHLKEVDQKGVQNG